MDGGRAGRRRRAARRRISSRALGSGVSHRSAAVAMELAPDQPGSERRHRGAAMEAGRGVPAFASIARFLSCPADVTLRRGIPVTTPARTIADLRRSDLDPPRWRDLRSRTAQGDPPGERARPADRRRGRQGSDPQRPGGATSCASVAATALPRPEVNVRIGSISRSTSYGESKRLVVETDSYLYHRGEAGLSGRPCSGILELMRRGYEVLRLSERQIDDEPSQCGGGAGRELAYRRRQAESARDEHAVSPGPRGGRWCRGRAATRSSARRRSAAPARACRRSRGRPRTRRRRSRGRRRRPRARRRRPRDAAAAPRCARRRCGGRRWRAPPGRPGRRPAGRRRRGRRSRPRRRTRPRSRRGPSCSTWPAIAAARPRSSSAVGRSWRASESSSRIAWLASALVSASSASSSGGAASRAASSRSSSPVSDWLTSSWRSRATRARSSSWARRAALPARRRSASSRAHHPQEGELDPLHLLGLADPVDRAGQQRARPAQVDLLHLLDQPLQRRAAAAHHQQADGEAGHRGREHDDHHGRHRGAAGRIGQA